MEEQRAGIYMGINIKNAIPIAFNIFDEKYFQKDKSNNWLKLHGKVMRRKPFKRETQVKDISGFRKCTQDDEIYMEDNYGLEDYYDCNMNWIIGEVSYL